MLGVNKKNTKKKGRGESNRVIISQGQATETEVWAANGKGK